MQADRSVYKKLLEEKKLPIRHRWIRNVGTTVQPQPTETPESDIIEDIIIGSKESRDLQEENKLISLEYVIKKYGFFKWRMWSKKNFLPSGNWTVKILYYNRSSVLCENGMPCEYNIQVE